jgi:hypothetical protein
MSGRGWRGIGQAGNKVKTADLAEEPGSARNERTKPAAPDGCKSAEMGWKTGKADLRVGRDGMENG